MPPVLSQTDIVNGALADLGSRKRITAIDDNTSVAAEARTHWALIVAELLPKHPWNHAIKRVSLPLEEVLPEGLGWTYAYTIPADCERWLVPDSQDEDLWFEGEEEGGRILTDREAPLPLRYVSSILGADPSRWRPHFVTAVRTELAARMADFITQSETAVQRTREIADEALRAAKHADGMATGRTSRARVTRRSNWLTARERPYPQYGR